MIIVTGEVDSGKTEALKILGGREKERGNSPTGVIAPGVYQDGNKIGFDAMDLSTGHSVPLARTSWEPKDGFSVGRFLFSNRGFDFARCALLKFKSGGVVFIDEVGPIELRGAGYADCLRRLLNSDISRLYMSVRNGCVEEVVDKFLLSRQCKILRIEEF